jgi:uncharacterized protein YfbU (UPF0304 family)
VKTAAGTGYESSLSNPGRQEPMELRSAEKLLLIMLSEIYERSEIQGQIEPRSVREAISSGNAWSLLWEYPHLFGTPEANEAVRREVLDFLDMWSVIEASYECLSPSDKERVAEANPLGRNVQFYGFDENSETKYVNVTRFVVDQLDRFSEFRRRTLSAPMPAVRIYRRMYTAFRPMRESLLGNRNLEATQIIQLLDEIRGVPKAP